MTETIEFTATGASSPWWRSTTSHRGRCPSLASQACVPSGDSSDTDHYEGIGEGISHPQAPCLNAPNPHLWIIRIRCEWLSLWVMWCFAQCLTTTGFPGEQG